MSRLQPKSVPLSIGSGEARAFGWFHPPEAPRRRCGVVVCSPIGDEFLRAHRSLRHLAERLQRAGFPVLRFDFHGTGDSPGDERDPDRVRTWLSDIGRASDELRALSGADRICLAGLRLGATLATRAAAERGGVDSLILWNPFPNGRSFVVESIKLHKMQRLLEPEGFAAEPPGYDAGGEQALGFVLTPATIAALDEIDLSAIRRPARRAMVVSQVAADGERLERLGLYGVDACYRHFPGQKFLLTSTIKAAVPEAVLDALTDWMTAQHPEVHPAAAVGQPPPQRDEDDQPFPVGDGRFGMLALPPATQRHANRPAILLLNAGTVHRVGPHRLYVKMARRFTALGFPVLRLDLSGIGDSPAAAGCDENLCYPRDALGDVRAAMRALDQRLGPQRVLLAGLCSGADLTFHIALREPRVTGVLLINPLTFCVNDQALVETYQPARYYTRSLVDTGKLKRLFRGQVELQRAVGALVTTLAAAFRRRRANRQLGEAHMDVPGLLRSLAARGTDVLLVAGDRDPGVVYVDQHFGEGMRALDTVERFRRVELRGTDHTFTSLFAQELLLDTITRHLQERHAS